MENWKTIKNHENFSVSNLGEIKNTLTGELLKKHNHPKGYDQVYFAGHTFLVHKIVCEAFHENPDNKPCVDHIDGNKKNNAASNLRWVSYSENNSNPNTKWKNNINLCKPVERTEKGGHLFVVSYNSITEAAKDVGTTGTNIRRCIAGRSETSRRYRAKGYMWRFMDTT